MSATCKTCDGGGTTAREVFRSESGRVISTAYSDCPECNPDADAVLRLRAERAALESALRKLVEALPRCDFRGVVEGTACTRRAEYGTTSHEPTHCEEHRHLGYQRNRRCNWADAACAAAAILGEM